MKKYLLFVLILIWLIPCLIQAQTLPKIVVNLTVDKSEAKAGEILTYAIHYRNDGPTIAYDLKLKHYLPPGATVQSASFPLIYLGQNTLNFDLGKELKVGDSRIITVRVELNQGLTTGLLVSQVILEYKEDRQRRGNLIVFDKAETLLKSESKSGFQAAAAISMPEDTPWYSVPLAKYRTSLVKTAQAAEIKVGSNSLIVNLLLACLIATLSVGLLIGFDKLRKLSKMR